LGGALGQWPLGFWSDRVDRRWVIGFAALCGILVATAIVLFFELLTPLALMMMGAAWGAVAFPLYAVSVAHTNDHARPGEYVMISSGLLLMYGVGAILGPFAAPAAMKLAGARGLYLYTAAIHLLLLAYIAFRFIKRIPKSEEEHRPFVEALAATQTASHVYEDEIAQEKSQ
jgi:MFS family permease